MFILLNTFYTNLRFLLQTDITVFRKELLHNNSTGNSTFLVKYRKDSTLLRCNSVRYCCVMCVRACECESLVVIVRPIMIRDFCCDSLN